MAYRKKKTALKDFNFDGTKIIRQQDPRPTELKAVIYCRVSSDQQVNEWFWLESQERVARERCKRHTPEIEVVKVFTDWWVSWKYTDREWFNACVEFLKEQNKHWIIITHFVCRELSRISRPDLDNVSAAFELEWKIKQYGVEIVDVIWGTKDITDEDKLMKAIQYIFAWYDRRRINKICQNGKRARLMEWYRPFSNVPTWYKRRMISKRDYVDEIDWDTASIIKDWFELFAHDPNMWKKDLYDYFMEKWLAAKMWKKPWLTLIDKMFQLHRLYFYAWYCIYPLRWIDNLIEWKHEWIIDLETAELIRKKLLKWNTVKKWVLPKDSDDEFILRWLITCEWCWRKFTWWYTTKSSWKKYPYYWCQRCWCPERAQIPQKQLEDQVYNMIKSVTLPDQIYSLLDAVLSDAYEYKEENWSKEVTSMKNRIKEIEKEKLWIQEYLRKWRWSVDLQTQMEDDWATLNQEQIMLEDQINCKDLLKIDRNNKLKKIRNFVKNPLIFWEYSDWSLKKLIVDVRFWDSLTYSKSRWLQTRKTSTLYSVLSEFSWENTRSCWGGDSNPQAKGIRTSSVHVYQFHHLSIIDIFIFCNIRIY